MTDAPPPTQTATGGAPAGRPVGHDGTRVDVEERAAWSLGAGGALVAVLLTVVLVLGGIVAMTTGTPAGVVLGIVTILVGILLLTGVGVISPGQTLVVQLFGRYLGTIRRTGLVVTVPLTTSRRVSVRVRNFETSELKVNDADGNPINIAAIVVWQVADTAKASFAVEDYGDFVSVQAESALRHVAMSHPYDGGDDVESLRGATE
ncbi:MAG: SPFH domain-containing protein, partial [Actinomycetes bacterium]